MIIEIKMLSGASVDAKVEGGFTAISNVFNVAKKFIVVKTLRDGDWVINTANILYIRKK